MMAMLRAVLSHRDFRFLWLGQSVSVIGDRLVVVALALFVTDLTGNASDLGLVLAAYTLPLVGFLLLGGVWADRLPRHRVVIGTDLIRFALHALLAVLILTDAVQVWHVVAIEACFGTAEAFFRPAMTGLLPQTVPEDQLQEANAVFSMTQNLAEFAGPALGTLLVVGLGPGTAFAFDALTFLVSAAFLTQVRPRARGELAERRTVLSELLDGFREVRSRAWVWVTISVFSLAIMLALAPYFVLGPTVAREQYGATSTYGVLAAVFGAGAVGGALAGLRWRPRRPMRTAMLVVTLWPLSVVLFALGAPLWVVCPALLTGGCSVALFEIWWLTALAEHVPPQLLSRVTAYDWMGSLGPLPVGYLLAGPAAGLLGASEVLAGGATLGLLTILLGLVPRETRDLRRSERGAQSARNSATPSSGVEASA